MQVLKHPALLIPLLLSLCFVACGSFEESTQPFTYQASNLASIPSDTLPKKDSPYTISASHHSENLQIFMINGKEELAEKKYLSLEKALASKKVKVVETGQVNELRIFNNSDEYVFIHSGDIVKGGKQDRTISYDVIIPPHAENIALESFCVEQGRWRKRGNEALESFSSTSKMLSSRELKLSAKYDKNQHKVWENVAKQTSELSRTVSDKMGNEVDISNSNSQSSLQLALENKDLSKLEKEMKAHFSGLLASNPHALGFAYAINGEVYGVDMYNNRALFQELWPRLLGSAIVEAISQVKPDSEKTYLAKKEEVHAFMDAVQKAQPKKESKTLNKTTVLETTENKERNLLFSTLDKDKGTWVHRNYMKSAEEKGGQNTQQVEQRLRYNYLNQQRIIQPDSLQNQRRN